VGERRQRRARTGVRDDDVARAQQTRLGDVALDDDVRRLVAERGRIALRTDRDTSPTPSSRMPASAARKAGLSPKNVPKVRYTSGRPRRCVISLAASSGRAVERDGPQVPTAADVIAAGRLQRGRIDVDVEWS